MTWVEVVPAVVVAAALLYLPGVALGWAMGARRFTLVAIAPALSVAIIALSAVALGAAGIESSVIAVAVPTLAVSALVYLLRRAWLLRRGWPQRQPSRSGEGRGAALWLVAGVAIGALVVIGQLLLVLGEPDAISQTFDAPFHLNVLRDITETGSASSFQITSIILPEGQSSFYPAAWHGVASLVVGIVDVPIPAVANAVNLVVASIVWVSGCTFFARTLMPSSRVAVAASGILAAAFPAFPLLMLDYGVLYSYFLALALVPVALALTLSLSGLAGRAELGRAWHLPVIALALVACSLAQPAAAFAWGALAVPLAIAWGVRVLRSSLSLRVRLLAALAVVVGIGMLGGFWYFASRSVSAPWGPHASPLRGLFEAVAHAPMGAPVAVVASALVVIGLLDMVVRRHSLWLVGSWSIAAALYFVSAAVPFLRVRRLLTGIFYSDAPRLAALMVMVSVLVAVVGVVAVCRLAARVIRHRRASQSRLPRPIRVLAAGAGLLALLVGTQGAAIGREVHQAATKYRFGAGDWMLSENEYDLIERLPETTGDGAVIVGSAWTGTSLAYALADREVVNPHFGRSSDPAATIVNARLNQALTDASVCPAVRSLGVGFVLDFGTGAGDAGHGTEFDGLTDYPGLRNLVSSGTVSLVDREGAARLYRITAC